MSAILRAFVSVVLLTAFAFIVPAPATVASHPLNPLQPGDRVTTPIGGCTLNFVFDGLGSKAGKVYFGTAGHCVEPGHVVSATGYANFGTTVYDNDGVVDFALIEVNAATIPHVSAGVKGWPQYPTGVTSSTETLIGDIVQFSGFGIVFNTHPITQENRAGVLISDGTQTYCADGPVIFGDSGGPVVHFKTGKALGVVSHLGLECLSSLAGGTIQGAIAAATGGGFPIALRTV